MLNNIAIVSHRSIMPDIPGGDLKKFFLTRGVENLVYITHPLLLLKESYKLSSQYEQYNKQKGIKTIKAYHFMLPESFLYIKDFFYTLFWIYKTGRKYDLYFGINNINALSGLLLKCLGRVEKVIYYTIDLYPQRFNNKIINWIYHQVDKICVRYCDETWNVSAYLIKYRQSKGMIGNKYTKQFTVPIGIWFDEMKKVPINKVKKTKIVYVGHLKNFYGVDLAIKALPLIIKKIPKIKLEIIGGGEQLDELKLLVNNLSLKDQVKFYGWKEKKEAENLLADGALGLAPFNTLISGIKLKNADPAKIKDYLSLGLPVIMTNASVNAKSINKAECGIIINYTPESLANAVLKLLLNEKLWEKYRKNSLQYIKKFDWNNLFTKNIKRLI